MSKFEYNLGDQLHDKVTGLKGICIGRIEYLNGCVQYAIKPRIGNDGKVYDAEWVDSQQVERVGKGLNVEQKQTGGSNMGAPRL